MAFIGQERFNQRYPRVIKRNISDPFSFPRDQGTLSDEDEERYQNWYNYGVNIVGDVENLIPLSITLTLIGTSFVLARLFVRRKILKQFFIDDALIVLSMIMGIVSLSGWIAATATNINMRQAVLSFPKSAFDDLELRAKETGEMESWKVQRIETIGIETHIASSVLQATFGRLSILVAFRRLAISDYYKAPTKRVRRFIDGLGGFMVLAAVPMIWLPVDPRWPPGYGARNGLGIWEFTAGAPTKSGCIHSFSEIPFYLLVFLALGTVNALMDLIIFGLPFLIFHWAALSWERKRGLYLLFSFGFIVFLISVCRAAEAGIEIDRIRRNLEKNPNFVGGVIAPYVFGIGEANVVMVGACLPVLKPLWRKFTAFCRNKSTQVSFTDDCD